MKSVVRQLFVLGMLTFSVERPTQHYSTIQKLANYAASGATFGPWSRPQLNITSSAGQKISGQAK